jgi:hypothetical protein
MDESIYSSCRGCGNPFHTRNECPYVERLQEAAWRYVRAYEEWGNTLVSYYEEPLPPPKFEDYKAMVDEESDYSYGKQYQNDYCYEPEGVCADQTEEDRKLAILEAGLSKLEEYLSAPNLSDQDRIRCLAYKCQGLTMKIELEEHLSPLPDDIRDYSHMEEEVVEGNTTPMNPLSDEELLVNQMVCENGEVDEYEQMRGDLVPVLSVPINKVGDEGPREKVRKTTLQDTGLDNMKWIHNSKGVLDMPPIVMRLWMWCVNYRAFIGNSAGKCALRPP